MFLFSCFIKINMLTFPQIHFILKIEASVMFKKVAGQFTDLSEKSHPSPEQHIF